MTCALGLAAAGSASANEVTLWACHAPDGTALGVAPLAGAATFGGGCATDGTGFDAGGVRTVPGQNGIFVPVPPDLTLKRLMLTRRVTGLGNEGGLGSYSATFRWGTVDNGVTTPHSAVLDSSNTDVSGDVDVAAPDNPGRDRSVLLALPTGPEGAAAEFQRVGLVVEDNAAPTAAVGGIGNTISAPLIDPKKGPVQGNILPTKVAVWANDNGAGLWKAVLYVDGQESGFVEYVNDGAGAACVTALDGGKVLPLSNDCQHNGHKDINLDSTLWGDGPHTLAVKLYDASGNVADVLKNYATSFLNHPDPGNKTADLNIGSGSSAQQNGSNNGNNGSGGVAGESATSCNSPRLSMELSQRPLKVSNGVPVLLSGKRYRFRGKLTCVIDGKRRSALPKTPIELLNTIGKHTYRKGGATVRDKGAITLILAYKSSRTLVFRYTNPDGRRSQVKLKIKVVKKSR